jgi:hypothetical protein
VSWLAKPVINSRTDHEGIREGIIAFSYYRGFSYKSALCRSKPYLGGEKSRNVMWRLDLKNIQKRIIIHNMKQIFLVMITVTFVGCLTFDEAQTPIENPEKYLEK